MAKELIAYEEALAKCEKRDVGLGEFNKLASKAGWEKLTIQLFTRQPYCRSYVKVGNLALRII